LANPFISQLISPYVNKHLSVQTASYGSTFIYFMTIWTSGIFMLIEPVLMLSLYKLFNNWSIITIFLFILHWFLAFYAIFLAVATVDIQAYMLSVTIYLNGVVFFLFVTDIIQVTINLFFLLESIQFTLTDFNAKRTVLNKNSLDLMFWTLLETVPRVVQLGSFYFFLIDINDYFSKDPTRVDGKYSPLAFSRIIDFVQFYIDDFWIRVDFYLATSYNWTVYIFTEYLSYVKLVGYIYDWVLTPSWVFFFNDIFGFTPATLRAPTAEDI
jgi:hypothetical protein